MTAVFITSLDESPLRATSNLSIDADAQHRPLPSVAPWSPVTFTLDLMSSPPPAHVVQLEGFFVNLSPMAFRKWARQYYDCAGPLLSKTDFSPVPYFLLCRAIELELKAEHLETKRQPEVKRDFGHDLAKSYAALPGHRQVLAAGESNVLNQANAIYSAKGFEYFNPEHALRGYSQYPDLSSLNAVARKLLAL